MRLHKHGQKGQYWMLLNHESPERRCSCQMIAPAAFQGFRQLAANSRIPPRYPPLHLFYRPLVRIIFLLNFIRSLLVLLGPETLIDH